MPNMIQAPKIGARGTRAETIGAKRAPYDPVTTSKVYDALGEEAGYTAIADAVFL
jgi:hypothetical protein